VLQDDWVIMQAVEILIDSGVSVVNIASFPSSGDSLFDSIKKGPIKDTVPWLFLVDLRTTDEDGLRSEYTSGIETLEMLIENGWGGSEDGERLAPFSSGPFPRGQTMRVYRRDAPGRMAGVPKPLRKLVDDDFGIYTYIRDDDALVQFKPNLLRWLEACSVLDSMHNVLRIYSDVWRRPPGLSEDGNRWCHEEINRHSEPGDYYATALSNILGKVVSDHECSDRSCKALGMVDEEANCIVKNTDRLLDQEVLQALLTRLGIDAIIKEKVILLPVKPGLAFVLSLTSFVRQLVEDGKSKGLANPSVCIVPPKNLTGKSYIEIGLDPNGACNLIKRFRRKLADAGHFTRITSGVCGKLSQLIQCRLNLLEGGDLFTSESRKYFSGVNAELCQSRYDLSAQNSFYSVDVMSDKHLIRISW